MEEQISTYALGWTTKLPSVPSITNSYWVKTIVDAVKNIAQENTVEGEEEFTESIYPGCKLTRRSDLLHVSLAFCIYFIKIMQIYYISFGEDLCVLR